jgi:hypothetical protein
MRIIGEDGSHKIVQLNQAHKDDSGKERLYKMDAGTYDVTVDTGPSYASKRQEAATSMMDLARNVPLVMQVAPDLVARNMDWPGAQDLADRFKKTLAPGLADEPGKQSLPPQAMAAMQQMQMQIQQLAKMYHAAQDLLDQRKPEIESKERIELAKIQADIEINLAKLGTQRDIELLRHQVAEVDQRIAASLAQSQAEAAQAQSQPSAPPTAGAPGASAGPGAASPTGGASPGSPMGT